MLIDINLKRRVSHEYADTLSREQRTQARERMTRQVAELLAHSPRENIYYASSG